MNKIRRLLWYIIVVAIISCCFVGIIIKKQCRNDTSLEMALQNKNLPVEYMEEDQDFIASEEIKNYDDLYHSADVIVQVSVPEDGKRLKFCNSVLSQVKVKKQFKGTVESDVIDVFEPVIVGKEDIYSVGSYTLMVDGCDYILFLKKLTDSHYSKNKFVYLPTTTAFSKYQCNNNKAVGEIKQIKENAQYLYSDIMKFDMVTKSKEIYEKFGVLQKEVEHNLLNEVCTSLEKRSSSLSVMALFSMLYNLNICET